MNTFFEGLKNFYPDGIEQKEWETALQDEEYLEDGILKSCFQCQNDTDGVTFITGNGAIFAYIGRILGDADIFKRHYLEFAKDWLYSRGIFENTYSDEAMRIKAIVCKNCGGVLGFVVNEETIYPYFGYLDDLHDILAIKVKQKQEEERDRHHIAFREYSLDNLFENKIKNNIDNFKTNETFKNYEKKKDLLYKLDNNKNKMASMLEDKSYSMNDFMPILSSTLNALKELNEVLEKEKK